MAIMLTTRDNPVDPREDFAAWYAWDVGEGYNTCQYLARIAVLADDFPQEFNDRLIEKAADEIIALHGDLYKKLPVLEAA